MKTEQTQHARDSAELRRLCSERDALREKVAEQAREIAVLKANVVTDNSMVIVSALAELERLKAQPSGAVQWPDADEIMQMAFEEGQPGEDASGYYFELEEFDLFIQRLMEEVARLNSSPVSAGEPVYQFQCREIGEGDWEPCDHSRYMYCQKSPEMDTRVVQVQALSAPSHGEQVLEVVPGVWCVRDCEDSEADLKGFIVSEPRVDGVRASNSVWPTDTDPAHRLLYELLSATPSAGSQKEQK